MCCLCTVLICFVTVPSQEPGAIDLIEKHSRSGISLRLDEACTYSALNGSHNLLTIDQVIKSIRTNQWYHSPPDRLMLVELASFFFREHAFLDEQLNELISGSQS